MHQFDVHHSELKGFSKYFHDEIFPFLDMQDSHRRDAIADLKSSGVVVAVVTICLAILVVLYSGDVRAILFPFVLGAIYLFVYFKDKTKNIKTDMKALIIEGICHYVGWDYLSEVIDRPDLKLLAKYGLLPHGFIGSDEITRRASFEDQMSGQAHGADFKSVEIHFEQKIDHKEEGWLTVLRGQIITLTFPRKFLGQTVVLRDKGLFNINGFQSMKRVGLVDPVFEKIFEAYSTDQVESRYLLDPHFMQKLVDLEHSADGKNIRFGFIEGQLFIVIETPNRFEAGSMLKSTSSLGRTQKVLNEIGAIYDVIDGVTDARR